MNRFMETSRLDRIILGDDGLGLGVGVAGERERKRETEKAITKQRSVNAPGP